MSLYKRLHETEPSPVVADPAFLPPEAGPDTLVDVGTEPVSPYRRGLVLSSIVPRPPEIQPLETLGKAYSDAVNEEKSQAKKDAKRQEKADELFARDLNGSPDADVGVPLEVMTDPYARLEFEKTMRMKHLGQLMPKLRDTLLQRQFNGENNGQDEPTGPGYIEVVHRQVIEQKRSSQPEITDQHILGNGWVLASYEFGADRSQKREIVLFENGSVGILGNIPGDKKGNRTNFLGFLDFDGLPEAGVKDPGRKGKPDSQHITEGPLDKIIPQSEIGKTSGELRRRQARYNSGQNGLLLQEDLLRQVVTVDILSEGVIKLAKDLDIDLDDILKSNDEPYNEMELAIMRPYMLSRAQQEDLLEIDRIATEQAESDTLDDSEDELDEGEELLPDNERKISYKPQTREEIKAERKAVRKLLRDKRHHRRDNQRATGQLPRQRVTKAAGRAWKQYRENLDADIKRDREKFQDRREAKKARKAETKRIAELPAPPNNQTWWTIRRSRQAVAKRVGQTPTEPS